MQDNPPQVTPATRGGMQHAVGGEDLRERRPVNGVYDPANKGFQPPPNYTHLAIPSMRLALLALLCMPWMSLGASAQPITDGYGIENQVYIGAKKKLIRNHFGEDHTSKVVRTKGCYDCGNTKSVVDTVVDPSVWRYEKDSITIVWRRGRVSAITFYKSGYKLKNGIGIGSTVEELQAAYGKITNVLIYRYPDQGVIFYTEAGYVTAIGVTAPAPPAAPASVPGPNGK